MKRNWNPWWSFATAAFVVACFLYLVSCTRAQQPSSYYTPKAKPVPAVRTYSEHPLKVTKGCDCGDACPYCGTDKEHGTAQWAGCPCGCNGLKVTPATWPVPSSLPPSVHIVQDQNGTILTIPLDMFPLHVLIGPPTKPTWTGGGNTGPGA